MLSVICSRLHFVYRYVIINVILAHQTLLWPDQRLKDCSFDNQAHPQLCYTSVSTPRACCWYTAQTSFSISMAPSPLSARSKTKQKGERPGKWNSEMPQREREEGFSALGYAIIWSLSRWIIMYNAAAWQHWTYSTVNAMNCSKTVLI